MAGDRKLMADLSAQERARLDALLSIASISASADHRPQIDAAAALVAAELRRAGADVAVRPTEGMPLVVGRVPASSGDPLAPRVVVYGHYDVQPPGDPDLWTSPPFVPTERDGNLYARGASDDKGNLFMLIVAVQRLAAAGRLGLRVDVVVDGEEESGGDSAVRYLGGPEVAGAMACIIFDSPMIGPERPAICTGVRGLVGRRVRVRTADADGHSGIYGGAALSAAHALMQILDAVTPRQGRLPVELYEGCAPAGREEVTAWTRLPAGELALAEAGLRPADAGAAEGFYARTLAGPSVDVHGLRCGDPGAMATIVPARAEATLSLRVAPGQDVLRLGAVFDRLLAEAAPAGAEVEIDDLGVAHPAVLDPAHPVLRAASRGITRATGWEVAPVRLGGTLPVVAAAAAAGVPTILSGFGLPSDRIHSPDEHIRTDYLSIGTRAAIAILEELADLR